MLRSSDFFQRLFLLTSSRSSRFTLVINIPQFTCAFPFSIISITPLAFPSFSRTSSPICKVMLCCMASCLATLRASLAFCFLTSSILRRASFSKASFCFCLACCSFCFCLSLLLLILSTSIAKIFRKASIPFFLLLCFCCCCTMVSNFLPRAISF